MNPQDFTKFANVEQFEAAVKTGQENFDKALKMGKDTAQKAYKTSADTFSKSYDKALAMTKEQVGKTFPSGADKFDEVADFGKANVDAFFAAGAIATKGFEAIIQEMTAWNKKAVETSIASAKSFAGIKTYQELVELQSQFARGLFDDVVSSGTKVSEMTVKVAGEAVEPLNARATKVAQQFAKPTSA